MELDYIKNDHEGFIETEHSSIKYVTDEYNYSIDMYNI